MSKVVFEVVHGNGTYKAADGSEKTRWQKIGVIFKSDKGNYSMKLDAIPTRRNEEGELWLNLFVPQDREEIKPAEKQQGNFRQAAPDPSRGDGFGDDNIPF
jgi:hypothetical protein